VLRDLQFADLPICSLRFALFVLRIIALSDGGKQFAGVAPSNSD
jgi:hypothetical protein